MEDTRPPFRKPTEAQQKRLERGRKMIREGVRDEKDLLSRFSTTSKYQARQGIRQGREELDKVPDPARNYDAYMGMTQMKKGGTVKESPAMMKKEVAFMKAKGAPKSMLQHEMKEAKGMKKAMGGKATMKYAKGGAVRGDGACMRGHTKGKMV
jgi:hypothetical protein